MSDVVIRKRRKLGNLCQFLILEVLGILVSHRKPLRSERPCFDPDELKKGMGKATQQLKAFSEAGGQILFGTDVGYIERFDTSEEFVWMSRAGMSFKQILASLTTNPAQRFGESAHSGRIAKGMDGDLVVLRADPEQDAAAFSKVRYTIRSGRAIYSDK